MSESRRLFWLVSLCPGQCCPGSSQVAFQHSNPRAFYVIPSPPEAVDTCSQEPRVAHLTRLPRFWSALA